MGDEMFDELLASLREAKAIMQGEAEPSRIIEIPAIDVKAIRAQHELSQEAFAWMLGISVKTLRNWEQGRRRPEGPARILLLIAQKHPQAIWDVVGHAS